MSLLTGRRILLVEDESLVAMLGEDMLIDLGCDVTVAMRIDQALALARTDPFDLAVLDVNLGDAQSYPVADLLFARCVPFLFATGYGQHGLDEAYRAVPVLQKPYQQAPMAHLLSHLLTCVDPARKGEARPASACSCGQGVNTPPGAGFRADVVG